MTRRITMQAAAAYWAKITGTPRPHRGTLIRWATKGVRGVRLVAEPIAGRWYTTSDAIEDFHRRMPRPAMTCSDPTVFTTRAAQVERAVGELDQMLARRPAGRRAN